MIAFFLSRPQLGENIGAVARAMQNFGLKDLRLIAPRDGWPNPRAFDMATHATDILRQAGLFSTLADASGDVHRLYATTARGRDMNKPVLALEDAVEQMVAETAAGLKIGVVFGPERTGLENDEVAQCSTLLTIPTDPDNASLNLAQASLLVAYEWFKRAGQVRNLHATSSKHASFIAPEQQSPAATQAQIAGLLGQLEESLEAGGFFKTEAMRPRMWRNITNIFTRAGLSEQEVNTLRGVIRALRTYS